MSRTALLQILTLIQNSAENLNRDIMTFSGFCSFANGELADYVLGHFRSLKDEARKAVILARTRAIAA